MSFSVLKKVTPTSSRLHRSIDLLRFGTFSKSHDQISNIPSNLNSTNPHHFSAWTPIICHLFSYIMSCIILIFVFIAYVYICFLFASSPHIIYTYRKLNISRTSGILMYLLLVSRVSHPYKASTLQTKVMQNVEKTEFLILFRLISLITTI